MSRSFLAPPRDLRLPTGFEHVYRVGPARSQPWLYGWAGEPERLERRSGALRAVFDRSVYRNTRFGAAPEIPAGTVFHIGPEPEWPAIADTPIMTEAARPAAAPSRAGVASAVVTAAPASALSRPTGAIPDHQVPVPVPVSEPADPALSEPTRVPAAPADRTARLMRLATEQPSAGPRAPVSLAPIRP